MDYDIVFESDRIYFIRVSELLVNDYMNMVNDIEVQKYIGHSRKYFTFEKEIEWIRNKLKKNAIVFSMIEKETKKFIGNIEIININNGIGELGIAITPKMQDKHFGQEAIKRFIKYSFNDLNLDGLELNVFNFNPRGIKCYENVGFIRDGYGKTNEEYHMILKKK